LAETHRSRFHHGSDLSHSQSVGADERKSDDAALLMHAQGINEFGVGDERALEMPKALHAVSPT
jgi:hypothetical protein